MTIPAKTTLEASALRWQEQRLLLAGVTTAAAVIDTLAFVYLGKVFVSVMTGNLLFVGIGAGAGDGALLSRAAIALGAFLVGAVIGARLTPSRLSPDDPPAAMRRTLLIEAALLGIFGLLWLIVGPPSVALIVVGAVAMGMQAAVAIALHLPNVATVAMTATLAQLAALAGWREREGRGVVAATPGVPVMLMLCACYLGGAIVVAAVPETPVLAFVPMVLVLVAAGRSRRGGERHGVDHHNGAVRVVRDGARDAALEHEPEARAPVRAAHD
jgi:uncharacterized membrane protein YoaK (UPF0700 family)